MNRIFGSTAIEAGGVSFAYPDGIRPTSFLRPRWERTWLSVRATRDFPRPRRRPLIWLAAAHRMKLSCDCPESGATAQPYLTSRLNPFCFSRASITASWTASPIIDPIRLWPPGKATVGPEVPETMITLSVPVPVA